MGIKSTYNQIVRDARGASRVLLYQEIYGDLITPLSVFKNVAQDKPESVLLEFSDSTEDNKGYAFIGFDPIVKFSSKDQKTTLQRAGSDEILEGDPIEALRKLKNEFNTINAPQELRLTGGAVGYMTYDAIRLFEDIPDRHHSKEDLADFCLNFYRCSITFDYTTNKVLVAKIIEIDDDLESCYQQGMEAISEIINNLKKIKKQKNKELKPTNNDDELKIDLNDQNYANIIDKAKKFIKMGDVFQVVISRVFQKKYEKNPFDIYRALKKISPSPYHFYIKNKDHVIVGASPEKVVSLKNNIIESRPLAGTRPRGNQNDEALAQELKNDPKEIAEHMMLVDLARNDVGSVAKPGTVKVTELNKVINFSHVMHISSTVQGELAEDYDALDVLKAAFPAGTLSGAPKIRAMEIIDKLENSRRGIYGGAIIALDRHDNLETCIGIRTALIKNKTAYIRAGGGIVHDSDSLTEANESRYKARSVITAIELAKRGLE